MEYLDSKSEKVLKAILKIDSVSFQGVHYKANLDFINVLTDGKFIDNAENMQILLNLLQKEYIMTQTDPYGFPIYYPSVKGGNYFKSKWRSILYGTVGWLKILIGGSVGAVTGYFLGKI